MGLRFGEFDPGDADNWAGAAAGLGPDAVERVMHQALYWTWLSLPGADRSASDVGKTMRRLTETALAEMSGPEGILGAYQSGKSKSRFKVEDTSEVQWISEPGILHFIDESILTCWVLLPASRRTLTEVSAQVRRILERMLQNFEEDERAFRPEPA